MSKLMVRWASFSSHKLTEEGHTWIWGDPDHERMQTQDLDAVIKENARLAATQGLLDPIILMPVILDGSESEEILDLERTVQEVHDRCSTLANLATVGMAVNQGALARLPEMIRQLEVAAGALDHLRTHAHPRIEPVPEPAKPVATTTPAPVARPVPTTFGANPLPLAAGKSVK